MRNHRPRREIRGPGGVIQLPPDGDAAVDIAMLIIGETSGRPLDEVLAEFGRSRSTYYEKLKRFQEGGLRALLPKAPGPRAPWRRTHEVVRLAVTARLRDPARPADSIADELRRRGHRVSARSVERTLAEFGLRCLTLAGR